jgi:hypothetical protein
MRPLHEACKKDIKMLLGISKQALLGKATTLLLKGNESKAYADSASKANTH